MEKLINILSESTATYTNRLFNENHETRNLYCENLYELEKTLKKFYDLDSKRHNKETNHHQVSLSIEKEQIIG